MLSMRLACVLAVTAALSAFATVACSQTQAAPLQHGDDDDADGNSDDDTSTDGSKTTDGGANTKTGTDPALAVDSGPPVVEKSKMTFFVTSTPSTTGGNLGGLDGADKKCQDLATAVQAGDHTWHAYLSATGTNAKDRIGPGPWQNQKGIVIATTLDSLHIQDGPIKSDKLIDEKGAVIPPTGRFILTGTRLDGTPTANTCTNWTSADAKQNVSFGDTQPENNPNLGSGWNYAKKNPVNGNNSNCTPDQLKTKQSEGRVYCFATN